MLNRWARRKAAKAKQDKQLELYANIIKYLYPNEPCSDCLIQMAIEDGFLIPKGKEHFDFDRKKAFRILKADVAAMEDENDFFKF